MMEVELSKQDLDFLLSSFAKMKPSYYQLIEEAFNSDEGQKRKYKIQFDSTHIESMLDDLTELLTNKGLKNEEPNSFGNQIESIIDILSIKLYDD